MGYWENKKRPYWRPLINGKKYDAAEIRRSLAGVGVREAEIFVTVTCVLTAGARP